MIWDDLLRFERLLADDPPRRRVLFVTNMWPDEQRPYYGSFIASQARSLVGTGTAVDVLYVRGFHGVGSYLNALLRLPAASRAGAYDLVHAHYGHTAVASLGIRIRPLIVSFCGEDLLGAPRDNGITTKSRVEVACFRQVARLTTATITKSEEMEGVLPTSLRARNHVLPNGVDLETFAPKSREGTREQLGWAPEERVMLFLGNPDDPRKNVALARDAASLVTQRDSAARLHVAWGVGPEEVPTLMNAADVLLFPSRSEGSPNAVKEAMACALPIVATPVGDIPERLRGVSNCFVCAPDPVPFAEALAEAMTGGRAPEARTAVEALGTRAVAERLTAIYDEALARTAPQRRLAAAGNSR